MAAKKRTPARLPEPRGRRGHKAVDDQPALKEWLRDRLKASPLPTLDEIMEELKGTGFAIGRTAVWEFKVRLEMEKARLANVVELARSYNSSIENGDVLDIETMIANFGASKMLEDLLTRAGEGLSANDLTILDAFRKLQTSSSTRERAKFAVDRGLKAMSARIRREMQELLKKDPDTLRRVLKAIENAATEVRR